MYLSGGVDSSLVTALLAKHYGQEIRTYTIGFREDSYDESGWAKKVAGHCGTKHTEYILSVSEALEIAKDWGELFDEPFGDPSGIPTLLVSRLAGEEVKVVLSADGGDELFSGYQVYASVLERMHLLSRVPRSLGGLLSTGITKLSPLLAGTGTDDFVAPVTTRSDLRRRVHRFSSMLKDPTPGRLMEIYLSHWKPEEIKRLIGASASARPTANSYPGLPATQISLWDFQHYLPEDILTKVDRTTMAVSIEGREPLLDHRIVEYAFTLPPHLRRGQLGPKHLLKSILYRYVPRELVDRPKQGFGIPLNGWLRTDLKGLVNDYLAEDRIRKAGIMDAERIKHTIRRFYQGDTTLSTPLWFLLAFEMWREKWA
jgi:asparagine synthase (glutamine-hydrolysing)